MNQYKGEVKAQLGSKERVFRLTFESIVNIESRTNKSVIDLTTDMAKGKYSFKDLLIILHEGLMGAKNNVLQEAVGDMIMESGIVKASETAGIVLASAFTGNQKDEKDPLVEAENKYKNTQFKTI